MIEIDAFWQWAQTNQFLIGGIGTVAFGTGMYLLRAVPTQIFNFASRNMTTVFTITTRYRQYEEVAALLGRNCLPMMMRNYAPSDTRDNTDKRKLSPGYGTSWGRYKGTFFSFSRTMMKGSGEFLNEEISIRFYTRNAKLVEDFLEEAESLQDENRVKIRMSESSYFSGGINKPKRPLESVFCSARVKDALVSTFSRFMESEEHYARRGIPYKLCVVLHGQPGTGKTSLVHAIASQFNLSINYVTSIASIDSLVSRCDEGDLLVIEDIDSLGSNLKRKSSKPSSDEDEEEDDHEEKVTGSMSGRVVRKIDFDIESVTPAESPASALKEEMSSITLHKLLNAIDGFCTPHGLKVLITTNHPEKLDPALLRPGRTDLMLEIGALEGDDIRAMFEAFYGPASALILEGYDLKPETGSRLQQIFSNHTVSEARDLIVKDVSCIEHECTITSAA